jgi:uncharacterized membrane protein
MNDKHGLELFALWSLALTVIAGSIYVASLAAAATATDNSQTHGILIGGLMAALPMLINAIRNIGQSQTMTAMAVQQGDAMKSAVDQLAASSPRPVADEPLDPSGAEAERGL